MPRQAGVLLPLFSLRSAADWGVGEIPDLVPFARWSAGAGFGMVLMLPVNEASRGQHSPYGALSAFAIDPVYLSVDALDDFAAAGGHDALSAEDRRLLEELRATPAVRWDAVRGLKARALEAAFEAFVRLEWRVKSQRAASWSASPASSRPGWTTTPSSSPSTTSSWAGRAGPAGRPRCAIGRRARWPTPGPA